MLWMGSCFVESMEPKVRALDLKASFNPLGVCFHPEVLCRLMTMTADTIGQLSFEHQGIWKNYWLPASFSGSEEDLQNQIQKAIEERNKALIKPDWLVMTWGTAYFYEHQNLGLVGKCHKMPGSFFEKKRSSVDSIVARCTELLAQLREANPNLKVILTVSPVRHSRDGLAQNAVSKSILRLAAQQVVETISNVYYFPAYEIVLDELRDYRFFENDMVHPNAVAIDFIWSAFEKQFFSKEMQETNALMKKLKQLEKHQPLGNQGKEFDQWQLMIESAGQEITNRVQMGY